MRLVLPAATVERLRTRIRLDRDKSDPTSATVTYQLADLDVELTAASPGWLPMTWVAGGPPYFAQALVTGTPGAFRYWLRIQFGAETVLRRVAVVEFE